MGESWIGKALRVLAPEMSLAIAVSLHVYHCHFSLVSGMMSVGVRESLCVLAFCLCYNK